jgi:hypothetical protein
LRRIREALDAENAVMSGLLVYTALTEIASDKQSRIFQTTHGFIAGRCGMSQRTVQQRIKDLVEIGLLKCDVPKLRAPATYTLLHVTQPIPIVAHPLLNDEKRLPDEAQPLPSDTQRLKKAPLPTLEESPEESPDEIKKLTTKGVGKSLTWAQRQLAEQFEKALGVQWVNDAGKWVNRIKEIEIINDIPQERPGWFGTCTHVANEVDDAIKGKRINTSPAQYAEQIWKEFTGKKKWSNN